MKLNFGLLLVIAGYSSSLLAEDKLVIISPHRKSIQDEYVPAFKQYYKAKFKTDVAVDWIDQGGTSDDIRFIRAKFKNNPKTSGLDIFWGGGSQAFNELGGDNLLASYDLPPEIKKQIPSEIAGVPMYDTKKKVTWVGSALSSFGIFFNKRLMKMEKLAEPKTWNDLGSPKFKNQLSLTDPRRSGTATIMNFIVLEAAGWDKGWELLTTINANTKAFTQMSSDPIKAVVSGDAAASMAIDFYAIAKVSDLGEGNLGFILPEGQTVLDPDPIAVLKGAPNAKVAERFMEYVLSVDGQKLLVLPKGKAGGPKISALGRMSVNSKVYEETEGIRSSEINPFKLKNFLKLDAEKNATLQRTFNDLIGAVHVDTHKELKLAWDAVIKKGSDAKLLAAMSKPPITKKELEAMAKKWDDEVFRNNKINEWVNYARKNYEKIVKDSSAH
jgi:ABC-type Fe3+ transport system substrate-binding protein